MMREEMWKELVVLPMIVMIAPDIKGGEYEGVLNELNKAVSMINNYDACCETVIELMIVDKVPTFFNAAWHHENFEANYNTDINEIADYALWSLARRKQTYREFGVNYWKPMIILVSNFNEQAELTFMKNPEWLEQTQNRNFYFMPCCINENCINVEKYPFQCEIEVLNAEKIFEEYWRIESRGIETLREIDWLEDLPEPEEIYPGLR